MRFLILLTALFSLSAMACPSLSGVYKNCKSSNSQGSTISEIVIDQKINNRLHYLTISTKEKNEADLQVDNYVADGKVKTTIENDTESGVTIQSNTTASCTSQALTIKIEMSVDAEVLTDLTVRMTKEGKKLIQAFSGQNLGEPISETVICE